MNEYTVIDSFFFAEKNCQQHYNLSIASVDVDSKFTNISPDKTIDICIGELYELTRIPLKYPNIIFLLNIATKESFLKFN